MKVLRVASLRNGDAEAAGSDREGPADPGRDRRSIREDPDLQLQGKPHHRPPRRLHDAPAHRGARWRHRRAHRRRRRALHVRETQGSHDATAPTPSTDRRWPRCTSGSSRLDTSLTGAGIDADEAALDAEVLARHVLGWDRAGLIARWREPAAAGFHRSARATRRPPRRPGTRRLHHRSARILGTRIRGHARRPDPTSRDRARRRGSAALLARGSALRIRDRRRRHRQRLHRHRARPRASRSSHVTATDISPAALAVARRNAARLGVDASAHPHQWRPARRHSDRG